MGPGCIWILFTCFLINNTLASTCGKEAKCSINRIHGMKAADCFNQNIRMFPQCLSSDLQVLDISQNRIRKLDKKDLKRYSGLKMLYLSDNLIRLIQDEAFEGMNDLTTIDLSWNAIEVVPPLIFQLPSLKTLYLGHNNINIADTFDQIKSISSPLSNLHLDYISEDGPVPFPSLGVVPLLTRLNISGTDFDDMTPKQFAGLCNLKTIINENTTVEFINRCDCWRINRWLIRRRVEFKAFECDIDASECAMEISEEDLKTFQDCEVFAEKMTRTQKLNKGLIYAGIIAGIFVLCILVYIIYQKTNRIKPRLNQKSTVNLL